MIIYEVKSSIATVMSNTSAISKTLGILNKGDKIDAINIENNFAYFKYNNLDGYINLSSLTESKVDTGTIVIKYINEATSQELMDTLVHKDLELGKHTYYAEPIYGYELVGRSFCDAFLTKSDETKEIIFKYKEIIVTGSITVKYIDFKSLKDLSEPQIINELTLGSYTFSAISIAGYELDGDSTIDVTLRDDNRDKVVYFRYKKIIGTVTVKFIDEDSLEEIIPTEVAGNLPLGINQIFAIDIEGYSLTTVSPQIINLMDHNNEETVIFKYKKVEPSGTVTIRYADAESDKDVAQSSFYTDVKLGITATYSYKIIAGFNPIDSKEQEVTLTEENLNQTIVFKYEEILGSVKIKFVDANTNEEIKTARVSDSLNLGIHSFIALEIDGYELVGSSSQVILLTEVEPNEEIIFKYKRTTGSATIRFIDEFTLEDIRDPETISNLKLGTTSFISIDIDGYELITPSPIVVELTDLNYDETVVFKYKKR